MVRDAAVFFFLNEKFWKFLKPHVGFIISSESRPWLRNLSKRTHYERQELWDNRITHWRKLNYALHHRIIYHRIQKSNLDAISLQSYPPDPQPLLNVSLGWFATEWQNRKNPKSKKNGCEIATNRFSLHCSRKTQKPRTTEIKLVGKIYFYYYCNRNQPISVRFFCCEFYQFYNRIGFFNSKPKNT